MIITISCETGREWGRDGNYTLSLDTSIFTVNQTVVLILYALEKYQEEIKNA